MKPLVSIIIPVFNGEASIRRAVESAALAARGLTMEILVIDDGSTDGTERILLELGEAYPFLRILRQENLGPGAARNRGIREAVGEYLLFLDSDDALVTERLSEALSFARGRDVTVFGYALEEEGEQSLYRSEEFCSDEAFFLRLEEWYGKNLIGQAWAKIYSAAFLKENGILFPDRMWGEDRLFLFSALERAKSVAISPQVICRYIQRKGSLVTRFVPEKSEICLEIDGALLHLLEQKGALTEKARSVALYMYVKSLVSSFVTLFSPDCTLSLGEKRRFVKKGLGQKRIPFCGPFPKGCGMGFRFLAFVMAIKSAELSLLASYGVHLVSRILPNLFRRAKHAYNENEDSR